MAVATYPIKRLELDFIRSNVDGIDHIVKINIIRNPGLVGPISFLVLRKYVIDKDNADIFNQFSQLLRYMSSSVYMSESIYMGGLDIVEQWAKDSATLTIDEAYKIENFRFLLDYTIDPDDILMYSLQYVYKGNTFQTPFVISYKPSLSKILIGETYDRPCITRRNLRYRGPNESKKYDDMHKEIYCDIRLIENKLITAESDLNTNMLQIDQDLNSLYNIMDKIQSAREYLLALNADDLDGIEVQECEE